LGPRQRGYGLKLFEAQANAMKACQAKAQSPTFCNVQSAECEDISVSTRYTCQTKNTMTGLLFTGSGRGLTEAKYFTNQACFAGSIGNEFFCSGHDLQCDPE
jgi:hypothetical protein